MHRKLIILLVIASACSTSPVVTDSSGSTETSATPSSAPSETTPPTAAIPAATATDGEPDPIAENAAIFVATLEELVADTPFSGAILDSPQVFVAAGEVICVRLDAGDSVDEILVDYLNGFNEPDNEMTEEDVIALAGGVLGASVQLFCPQHIDLLGESS